jgi:hypothetical protein
LFIFGILLAPHVYAQVRDESIFGSANTNKSISPPVAPDQAKEKTISALHTNAVSGEFVGFDRLAGFGITITSDLEQNTNHSAQADAKVNAMIPQNIRALDGRNVSVEGFMIPMEFEKDKVIEFMLARDPMGCCYSTVPEIHQFIKVRVKSPGVEPVYSTARARGILRVGAERANGALSSIYRLDAENVKDANK